MEDPGVDGRIKKGKVVPVDAIKKGTEIQLHSLLISALELGD